MKKYLLMLLLSLLGCLSAIYFLDYAECYANYLLEKNAAFVNGPGGTLKFEYSKYCNTTYSLNFLDYSMLAPFFVVLINRYTQIVAAFWTVISIVLAVACMSFIGSGGDRKGCVECEWIFLYVLIFPIPALVCSIYGAVGLVSASVKRFKNKAFKEHASP